MDHIDPELLKRLDALAAKLGVAAQYLWSVLLRQAQVEAWKDIVEGSIWAVVAIVSGIMLVTTIRRESKKDGYDGWMPEPIILAIAATIFLLVGIVVAGCLLDSAIDPLFNPGYWALHHILN